MHVHVHQILDTKFFTIYKIITSKVEEKTSLGVS